MAAAANLTQAAQQAFTNLNTLWLANTLKTQIAAFAAAVLPTFPDGGETGRPVANWLTLISALSSTMPAASVPYSSLSAAARYVFGVCYMANQLQTQGLITAAQANVVLNQYNAKF